MKKKKKAIIDTYTTIYPLDIVVANKNVSLKKLQTMFTYSDGVTLDDAVMNGLASTTRVRRISDNKYCILIKDNSDFDYTSVDNKLKYINTIAHESLHAVAMTYEYIDQNMCPCSQEPMCYLIGYIAECVYKTLTKK